MLDSPFQFRLPNPKATNKSNPPPTLRKNKHLNTTSDENSMDPKNLSRLLGCTAAYPSQFNPPSNHTPLKVRGPLTAPNTFPPPIPPPSDLPLRIPSASPKLAELDEAFNADSYMMLGPQGMRRGYNEDEDENKSKHALRELGRHIADRTPYIQLASSRLQAATGLRNENPFDTPETLAKNLITSNFQALYNEPGRMADAGRAAKTAARNGGRKDSGVGLGLGVGLGGLSPKTLGLHVVDKETGKGLREFLLQKGKEQGHRKRSCRGISFHDFTPEIRTLRHQNVLLGHYGAEECRERVDTYEVDLPTVTIDPETGTEKQTSEPWLWILITRSMISFDPTSKSTMPPPECSEASTPSSDSTNWYTPQTTTKDTNPRPPILHPMPPPNFPHPMPISWLVFAAPIAHITPYPELTESLPTVPSPYPFAVPSDPLGGHAIQKRQDYDFSHSGVPIFEFSSASLFTNNSPSLNFLSVNGIGPWHSDDPFTEYSDEEYEILRVQFDAECEAKRNQNKSETELAKEELNRCGEFDEDDDEAKGINHGIGVQSPNRGVWWKEFYRLMYEDRAKWRGIRRAMGRGKCRVVVRWTEWVGDEGDVDLDLELKRLTEGRGKRITRSEARRRSGLGFVQNALIGGGLPTYDSSRRGEKVPLGGGGGKENGEAKKR